MVDHSNSQTMSTETRIDAGEKVTGKARYVEDLPDLPGTAYAAMLPGPYSHARLLSIDSSKAEKLPGVLAVLDRDHLDGTDPMLHVHRYEYMIRSLRRRLPDDQPLVAIDRIRFDGELVAVVAAEDKRTAQRALELIDVRYEPLPAVFDAVEALAPGAPVLHDSKGTNFLLEDGLEWGKVDQGFREADQIHEGTYSSQPIFHHPMENVGVCMVQFLNGEATVWGSTDAPFRDGDEMADFFGIDRGRVRFRTPYIGGHFGAKNVSTYMLASLFLSRKIGRPVRTLPSAQESFRSTARHAMVYKGKVGVKSDGTLTALDVDLIIDTGAYTTGAALATHNMVLSAWGCYRIPHLRIRARCAHTNKVPASHTRATGKVQTTWAVECLMDGVARQIGMEPVDFRKKNVLRRGETVTKGAPLMDTDYPDLMDRAVSAIQWDGRSSKRSQAHPDSETRTHRGKALVLSLRNGNQGGGRAYAMATVDGRGIVKIQHNAPDLGQGIYNLFSIIASRTLGVPRDRVVIGDPDTAINLPFSGVNAQRTTIQMGNAVQLACENLKREIVDVACNLKGGEPGEWRVADGCVWRGENGVSFGEIAASIKTLGDNSILQAIGAYSPPSGKGSPFGGLDHWAASAAAAEVEVDRETGEVRLLQYSVATDAGTVLHYPSARGQLEGGAIMGFGQALFEETVYQDGQLRNADPFQYRLPVMKDLPPSFLTFMVENGDGPGPFGSKGMSQTSIVTAAPVIGNAICDAVGVQVRSLPISPEKILRALGKI